LISELDRHPIEAIGQLITRAQDQPNQSNANRLRMSAFVILLKQEKDKRIKAKAQGIERDAAGRSRRASSLNYEMMHKCHLSCQTLRHDKTI
jgi:hypothetical protein